MNAFIVTANLICAGCYGFVAANHEVRVVRLISGVVCGLWVVATLLRVLPV